MMPSMWGLHPPGCVEKRGKGGSRSFLLVCEEGVGVVRVGDWESDRFNPGQGRCVMVSGVAPFANELIHLR